MPAPLPNIVLVLSMSHEPQLSSLGRPGYSGRACLTSESWATNLVSLLSSSVPSHHQVWTGSGKVGIHVDPLPLVLRKAGYRTSFIGPRDAENLVTQCGFNDLIILQSNDADENAVSLIEHPAHTPSFITCVIPEFSTRWQAIASQLASRKEPRGLVLETSITPLETQGEAGTLDPEAISAPFMVSLPGAGRKIDGSTQLWSILDIAPSLLCSLGIKVPYTMVGKDLHQYWLGKARKAIRFPRDRCLFEHTDGSKTMWNGRYLLAVQPGREAGAIFDLELRDGAARNLWDDPSSTVVKSQLLLELLWAQLDKECMPMPRIAGA